MNKPVLALLDYGMGNLASVAKALERAGAEVRICADTASAEQADGIVLPGVGNFGDGMRNVRSRGFDRFVLRTVESGKPLLGVCLGMQMMLESSEEAPEEGGLGIFKGVCRRFPVCAEKVPHVGWNQLEHDGSSRFLQGVPSGSHVYFVHSYYAEPLDPADVAAKTDYILKFASALSRGNVFAVQFHPEKSQKCGLIILENFVKTCNGGLS